MESNKTPQMGRITPEEQAESGTDSDSSAFTVVSNGIVRKPGAHQTQAGQPGAQQSAAKGAKGTQARDAPLPAWVIENLPGSWYPKSYSDVPVHLPDIQLVALYLSTRNRPDSLEGKLAALAVTYKFRGHVERCVHRYTWQRVGRRQSNMRDYYQQGWLGFFEALSRYDPSKASPGGNDPIMAYADQYIKPYVVGQLIADLPKEPATDNTRKAYKEALEAYIYLTQELGTEPTEEQVALVAAPKLPDAMGSVLNRRKIVHDLFRVLRDDTVGIAIEYSDDEGDGVWEVQVEGNLKRPEQTVLEQMDRQTALDIIRYAWNRAYTNLGSKDEARKLLVIQVLLNIPNTVTRPRKSKNAKKERSEEEDALRKIAKFIRGATPGQQKQQQMMEELWDLLWHNLYLERFGLKANWDDTRALFPSDTTKESLTAWHRGALMLADWKLTDE